MDEEIKEKLSNTDTWIRGIYILLFMLILGVTKVIIGAMVIFQFLSSLVTGCANERIAEFGKTLATYIEQIILYLSYSSNEKPFPFNDWPTATQSSSADKPKKRTVKKSAKKSTKTSTANPPAANTDNHNAEPGN